MSCLGSGQQLHELARTRHRCPAGTRKKVAHEVLTVICPSPAFLTGLRSALVGGHSRVAGDKIAVSGGRRVKVTANELDYLKTVADRAVTERQAMEQEYEKTSFQLQQAQTEVTQLASTTKYLKSQLKDYEEMMDRTIRNERKRAKVEIQKMKEMMEASIEQDRESLRRQFTRELERLQGQYELERAKQQEATQQSESWENQEHPGKAVEEDDFEIKDDDDTSTPDQDNSTSTSSTTSSSAESMHQQRKTSSNKPRRKSRRNTGRQP